MPCRSLSWAARSCSPLALIRLARIGRLALGDRAQGKPQLFTAYVTDGSEPGQAFKLDPDRALFVISEQGFWTPPDWDLTRLQEPRLWFNATLPARYAALAPFLPAA